MINFSTNFQPDGHMTFWNSIFFQKICCHLLKLCFIKCSNEREINLRHISKTFYTGMGRGGDWIKLLNTLYFSTVYFKCDSLTMFFKIILLEIFIIQLHWYSWRYRQDFHACGKCAACFVAVRHWTWPMLGGPHFGPVWPTTNYTPLLPLEVVRWPLFWLMGDCFIYSFIYNG